MTSETASQTPSGSFVVSVKLIIPVKSDSGLKIAFRSFSFEKVPETSADQTDDVAEPPIEPAS